MMRPAYLFTVALTYSFIGLCFLSTQVLAKEDRKDQVKNNPVLKWVAAEQDLIKDLSEEDKTIYFLLRNKASVLRAVRVVRRDVGKAVEACGEANPNLQDPMQTRFSDWKNAVEPILEMASDFVKAEVKDITVVKPKAFRKIMAMNDKAFNYQDGLIEKEIVTTEGACKDLVESMDRTEDDLVRLLQHTLLPENVIRQRSERSDQKS